MRTKLISTRPLRIVPLAIGAVLVLSACDPPTGASGGSAATCEPGDPGSYFVEQAGLVVVEAESAAVTGDWLVEASESGFTGSGYIQWDGSDQFSNPGTGILSYEVRVDSPGTYRVIWRGRINVGTDSTEHNDAWIRLADADYFYGERTDGGGVTYVYPRGIDEETDVKQEHVESANGWHYPEGSSKNGWFKAYLNQQGAWKWDANTSDNDAHEIFAEFLSPGVYTIEISGRSHGFAIDRIVLYHLPSYSENEATTTDHAQSFSVCG